MKSHKPQASSRKAGRGAAVIGCYAAVTGDQWKREKRPGCCVGANGGKPTANCEQVTGGRKRGNKKGGAVSGSAPLLTVKRHIMI